MRQLLAWPTNSQAIFHEDPAHPLIAATALQLNLAVVTSDMNFRSYDAVRSIWERMRRFYESNSNNLIAPNRAKADCLYIKHHLSRRLVTS